MAHSKLAIRCSIDAAGDLGKTGDLENAGDCGCVCGFAGVLSSIFVCISRIMSRMSCASLLIFASKRLKLLFNSAKFSSNVLQRAAM